jgi:hypothetical protein
MIRDITAHRNELTTTPERRNASIDALPETPAREYTTAIVIIEARNAATGTEFSPGMKDGNLNEMAIVAPKAAPEDIPMI